MCNSTHIQRLAATLVLMLWAVSAFAQYDSERMGHVGGAYISATQMMESLARSPCAYALRKAYSVSIAIAEVRRAITAGDQRELEIYLSSAEAQDSVRRTEQETIYDVLAAAKAQGRDMQTTCGMIVATVAQVYMGASRDWQVERQRSQRW